MTTNYHSLLPTPEDDMARIAQLTRERDAARRTIKTIRNLLPTEMFRPKNANLHLSVLQRIHNELIRYENTTNI